MSLEGILDTFSTAIFVYSLKDKRVTMINEAAKKMFLNSGDDLRMLLNPAEEKEFQELLQIMEGVSGDEEEKVLLKRNNADSGAEYMEVHVKQVADEDGTYAVCHAYPLRHKYIRMYPGEAKYNIYDQAKLFDFLHQVVGLHRHQHNIQGILAHLGELLDVSRVFIYEFEKAHNYCTGTFEWCRKGVPSQLENQKVLNLSNVEWIEILLENGVVAVSDIHELDAYTIKLLEVKGAKSVAAVPLFHSGIFYGFLGVDECKHIRTWKEEEINIMEAVGAIMATMLYRGTDIKEDYNHEIFRTVLNNMKTLIYITDINTHEILFANSMLKSLLGVEDVEGKKCYETFRHCSGPTSEYCPIGRLLDADGKPNPPVKWEFFNPLVQKWFSITDSAIRWVDGSYVHMEQATDITGIKENEKLLEKYATTDIMTGVLKRDWGIRKLETLLNKSRRENNNLIIYFVDMDSLKHINDSYGHNMGDAAIKEVAKALMKNFRKTDIVCRMGGDEFLIVVEDCRIEDADRIMERVRRELEEFGKKNRHQFKVNISIGRIEIKDDSYKSADEVIRHADREMYIDKKRNKARIEQGGH